MNERRVSEFEGVPCQHERWTAEGRCDRCGIFWMQRSTAVSTVQLWRVKVTYEMEVRGAEAPAVAEAKIKAVELVDSGEVPATLVEVEAVKIEGTWYLAPPF